MQALFCKVSQQLESHPRSIWGDDSWAVALAVIWFRSWCLLWKICLDTTDATRHSRPNRICSCREGSTPGEFRVFWDWWFQPKNTHDKNAPTLAPAVRRLVLWLKPAFAWVSFYFVRLCERLLPTSVLSLLLWPPAAVWDLVQVRQRKPLTCWHRFPESWRPKRCRFVLRQSLGLYHSQLFYMWPDRLCTARWLSRCRLEGGRDLIGSREGDRGVVWAFIAFRAVRGDALLVACTWYRHNQRPHGRP